MSLSASLPAPEPSPSTLRRDLHASVWDAGAYSVMVGIAESYFGAYALALGLGSAGGIDGHAPSAARLHAATLHSLGRAKSRQP